MLKNFILIFGLFILAVVGLYSQNQIVAESVDSVTIKYAPEQPVPNHGKTVISCAYYKFTPKDTILYTVQSHDSIVIDYGKPIRKSRHEMLQVICDSIGENNHYYLNLKLVAYKAEEFEDEGKIYNHSNSEWLNRVVYIEIDSVGNRFALDYDDSTMIGMCPGGAFQPNLFFSFEEACSDTGRSWTQLNKQDYLVENGLPCSVTSSTYMFTNRGNRDTLGYPVNRIDFIKTSQGSVTYTEQKGSVKVTNIIASGGILDIGTELKIPIHFYQTMEQKLSVHLPKGVVKPGRHYLTTFYTLYSYNKFVEKGKRKSKSKKLKK